MFLRRAALAALAAALALLAAELALDLRASAVRRARAAAAHSYSATMYSATGAVLVGEGPVKLQVHAPTVYRTMPGQKLPYLTVDSRGYRGPEIEDLPSGAGRVVVVGGSAAFGYGAPSDADALPARLSERLRLEVVNAAVIGFGSGQELSYLASELIDLKPRLVLAFDGYNDLSDMLKPGRALRAPGFNPLADRLGELAEAGAAGAGTLPRRLLLLPRIVFRRLAESAGAAALLAGLGERGPSESDIARAAKAYARNESMMAAVAAARGARFLCVLQPVSGSNTPKFLVRGYERFRADAKAALAKEGVPVLDLAEEPPARFSFVDGMHLDAAGSAAAADAVARRIASSGLLRARR